MSHDDAVIGRNSLRGILLGALILGALPRAMAAPVAGGTLDLIAQPEPPSLVHALVPHVSTQYVSGKILQSLLRFDNALKPVPVLARRWQVSDDHLTWTFDLQEGVTWHDGQAFTAEDVVFSLRDFYPQVDARNRNLLAEYVDKVEASGPLQVTIGLKKPFSPLLTFLGNGLTPIVAKHLYQGKGDYRQNPVNLQPIGTGPFLFKEWKRGAYIRLQRNPHYWKAGLPYLDAVVYHVIPDAASRAVAFERADVDVLRSGDADYADLQRLAALPGVVRSESGWELIHGQAFLQINTRKPGLDNAKVREAILLSLDRDFIVNNIFFGVGSPAQGAFSASSPEHDPQLPQHHYNPAKARQVLQESGVDVSTLSLRLLNGEKGGAWERLAEYTKQALQPLGIKVQVLTSDAATWYQRVSDWDFDLTYNFIFQLGDPYLSTAYLYRSDSINKGSPFGNVVGYANPQADALWRAAVNAADEQEREAIYRRLEALLNRDLPILPIYEMSFPTLYQARVKNLLRSATSLNDSLEDAYLEETDQ
jgi:peptide/nickel transport system substrate-binding protein